MLDNTTNQASKFRTKKWIETNDDSGGTYSTNSQIKFKTLMLKSTLCGYIDAYILLKGTITIVGVRPIIPLRTTNRKNKQVALKTRAPCTDCISEVNNTKLNNAKDLDVAMPTCNLIEYSKKY